MGLKKDISQYSLYVFDLDGTLYDQPKLRFIMATRLAAYYACHFWRLGELVTIRDFRRLKEEWDEEINPNESDFTSELDGIDSAICLKLANGSVAKAEAISKVIHRWIYINPLTAITKAADKRLIGIIDELRRCGKKVVVLSDYPTTDKLEALGANVDAAYTTTDARIGELKPSPKGLKVVLEDFGVSDEAAVMIGDRMKKDGESAVAANVDYIIVPRRIAGRNDIYALWHN